MSEPKPLGPVATSSALVPVNAPGELAEASRDDRQRAGFTLVIPVYNEAGAIDAVLDSLCTELDSWPTPIAHEIVVVDDGSTDGTGERLSSQPRPGVRLVRHDVNRGYGAAIKSGARDARFPWLVITDADGTYPHDAIAHLLAERASYDMIVGARLGKQRAVPLVRRPAKWVLGVLASYLTRQKIPDLNSGLRVIDRRLFERYEHILPHGFSLTTTITLAMLSDGRRVKYLPVEYLKRTGRSKIRPIADTFNFLILIVRTVVYFEPLRVFLPVSIVFAVVSIAVAVGSKILTGRVMDVTTVVLFVTAVQLAALGMIADMLSRRPR